MRIWSRIGKGRVLKAVAVGTVLAVATVAPGGAFVSGAAGDSSSERLGGSFDAFVTALADEVLQRSGIDSRTVVADVPVAGYVRQAFESQVGSTQPQDEPAVDEETVVREVADSFEQVTNLELPSVPSSGSGSEAAAAQAQSTQLEQASTADVVAALLALLATAQPEVLSAIDLAEAAVIAKLDQAAAQVVAAFAQAEEAGASGLEELEAFALQQIEAAKVLIGQVFDQIRAMVIAAFDEARNRIIEELTGLDLGEAIDEVLAEIAAIETWLQNALAGVQVLLQELGAGLPLP